MESSAQRRLRAIRAHLLPTIDDDPRSSMLLNVTAGEFYQGFSQSLCISMYVYVCSRRLNLWVIGILKLRFW